MLLYLYAEPERRGGTAITAEALARHRAEIGEFAAATAGAEVRFAACSYREWLTSWRGETRQHASALIERFNP